MGCAVEKGGNNSDESIEAVRSYIAVQRVGCVHTLITVVYQSRSVVHDAGAVVN